MGAGVPASNIDTILSFSHSRPYAASVSVCGSRVGREYQLR